MRKFDGYIKNRPLDCSRGMINSIIANPNNMSSSKLWKNKMFKLWSFLTVLNFLRLNLEKLRMRLYANFS